MTDENRAVSPDKGITRRELQAVIRRAVELYAVEADAEERLSEEEVLRIGAELGLPARHVRQALYELPTGQPQPTLVERALARVYGSSSLAVARSVPGDASGVLQLLEEYLTTREFLQLRRRQGDELRFEPASDAISKLSRAFSRPARQHRLAYARRVLLRVRALEPRLAHVRLELDLGDLRRRATAAGLIGGTLAGTVLAGVAFVGVGGVLATVVSQPMAITAGLVAGAWTFAGTVIASVRAFARRFRSRVEAARLEVEALLDRLERGERLEPPPAPWRRRLELGLGRGRPAGRSP